MRIFDPTQLAPKCNFGTTKIVEAVILEIYGLYAVQNNLKSKEQKVFLVYDLYDFFFKYCK